MGYAGTTRRNKSRDCQMPRPLRWNGRQRSQPRGNSPFPQLPPVRGRQQEFVLSRIGVPGRIESTPKPGRGALPMWTLVYHKRRSSSRPRIGRQRGSSPRPVLNPAGGETHIRRTMKFPHCLRDLHGASTGAVVREPRRSRAAGKTGQGEVRMKGRIWRGGGVLASAGVANYTGLGQAVSGALYGKSSA